MVPVWRLGLAAGVPVPLRASRDGSDRERLLEEFGNEHDNARGHLDTHHAVEQRNRPGGKEVAESALRDDIREEGGADQHTRNTEAGEGARRDGLGPLKGAHGPGLLQHAIRAGDIEEVDARAEDDAPLEAAARSEVTVRDHIEADDQDDREKRKAAEHSGVERPALAELAPLGLVAGGAKDYGDDQDAGEEDGLLTEGVEATLIEVDARDDIGGGVLDGGRDRRIAVGVRAGAEGGDLQDGKHPQDTDAGRAEAEDDVAHRAGHDLPTVPLNPIPARYGSRHA